MMAKIDEITEGGRTPVKAALAAWIGSALEYYDFAIYGTAAALIFPDIFFPDGNDSAAHVAAFATFGVAYVARPIGSFFMGHIGDRLGRRKIMIGTILLMGLSTFLVGCLPTYKSIGLLAPVLLVVLRIMQGISAAGEQAGANSMSFEHSPDDRRGFFTSFTLSGTQGGQILAPAIFLPLAAILSDAQLKSWGWRVPFWISAIVVLAGLIIRRRLDETPEFKAEALESGPPRTPLGVLLRDHWRGVLRVFFAAFIATVNTMFAVFALSFATADDYGIGISDKVMLWLAIVANIAVIPFWAILSDRIGRKPVFVTALVGSAILVVAFLDAIAHGVTAQLCRARLAGAGVSAVDDAVVARSQTRPDRSLTWADLRDQVARARRVLVDLGVGPGDRVAGYLPNCPEALVAFLAGAGLGAIWTTCAIEFGPRSVVDRFDQVEPVVLLVPRLPLRPKGRRPPGPIEIASA